MLMIMMRAIIVRITNIFINILGDGGRGVGGDGGGGGNGACDGR